MEAQRNIVWLVVNGIWSDKKIVDAVDDIEQADRISFREPCLLHVREVIKLRHPKRCQGGAPPIQMNVGFDPIFGHDNVELATRLLGKIVGQPWMEKEFIVFRHGTSQRFEFPPCEELLIYCGETAYANSGFLLYGIQKKPKRDIPAELRSLAAELEEREALD
jgi:hypothetical protein